MTHQFLWQRALQFKRELALISGLTLSGAAATLAVPWFAGQLLGGLIDTPPVGLTQVAGLLALALIAMTAFNIAASIVSAATSGRILARLRTDAYDHIQSLPIGFHDQSRRGDLLAMMTYEVRNLSDFLASTIANVPAMLMTASGAVILLFLLDPIMALVVPLLVPVFFIAMKLISRRLRDLAKEVRETEAEVMWIADSDLEMLPAIKSFAAEASHRRGYANVVEKARALNFREDRITSIIGPAITLIAAVAAILVVVLAGSQLTVGERDPGALFSFLLYAALLTRPVGELINIYGQFQIARGTISRVERVFKMPPEPGYAGKQYIERAAGGFSFEDVSFGYDGRDQVLNAVSFSIAPGEIVALTGENGAGKSTLIRLLLRFYEPHDGRILLGSDDIADLQVQQLRRQFGYVPQRALLFNGTIAANIVFGNEDVPAKEIERAAKLAQAWGFITDLPAGLETEIGDNGIQLSGGQRQRVALARALVSDPPILIFDEATSMQFSLIGFRA